MMKRAAVILLALLGCMPPPNPGPPPPPLRPAPIYGDPPPPPVHGCANHRYVRHAPSTGVGGNAELHVVGVYEGIAEDNLDKRSGVKIHVARGDRAVVLVLAAYDPVDWTVTVEPGTRLERVILTGYHAQRAVVPAGVPLDTFGEDDGKPLPGGEHFGYEWPSRTSHAVVEAVQTMTSLPLTSFRGCYASGHFAITDEPPTHEVRPATGSLAGCAHVLREPRHCMALLGHGPQRVAAIGLDSGTTCVGPVVRDGKPSTNASLGWIGDRLYACDSERGVLEIAVADGSTRIAPVPCQAVTTMGTSILVMAAMPAHGVDRYASFDDLLARKPVDSLPASSHASRFAAHRDVGYFAWHSTGEIQVLPLLQAKRVTSTIKLAGYDGWIHGLDVLNDGTLVVGAPGRSGAAVHLFDAATGAKQSSFSLKLAGGTDAIAGLKCTAP